MDEKELRLIHDFIRETPQWEKELRMQFVYTGGSEDDTCIYCGTKPKRMLALSQAVKKLLEIKRL